MQVWRYPHIICGISLKLIKTCLFRFDPQIFRGNSLPVKTCCFCKKDGHIKENCPELRKPPLFKLPPMTPEFDALVDFACKTCRGRYKRQIISCKKQGVIISRWRSRFSRQPLYFIGLETEGPFCRLTRMKKWVRDPSRKEYRSHIFALVKQVYHAF